MKLNTLVSASHTPFHADGSLAPEKVDAQAAFLAKQGITHVFITGSTGEAHSLTRDERLEMFRAWETAAAAHRLQVIAHCGTNCLEDAKAYARAAQQHGFVGVSALAPSYFKPSSVEVLVDWCAAIAACCPALPFYYYDIPVLTQVHLPMDKFLEVADTVIPNLAGIKFTNTDLTSYLKASRACGGKYDLPWGVDEMIVGAFATGARGGVGSTYNFAPKLNQSIVAACLRKDDQEAQRLQSISIRMIESIAATGYLGTAKALMKKLGVDVGPARLPLTNPTTAQVDALWHALQDQGFNEWALHTSVSSS
jgi:N-acetylneuraminate lyase